MAEGKRQLGARVSDETAEKLAANHDSATSGATFVLERWASLAPKLEGFAGVTASGWEYVLEAYPILYEGTLRELRARPEATRFTTNEANLILDALNGLLLTPGVTGQHLDLEVRDGIAINALDEKHEVDRAHLLAAIDACTLFERHTIEAWAARFWSSGAFNDEPFIRRHIALLTGARVLE